jgi:hypothetical protein
MNREEIVWSAHPFRERPRAGWGALVLIVAFAGLIYASFRSLAWSILALLVLILALNRFFFPSRFRADREGITARYLLSRKHYPWSSVRRFLYDARGGFLSTRARRSRLDAFQGLNILFGSRREEVIEFVKLRLGEVDPT